MKVIKFIWMLKCLLFSSRNSFLDFFFLSKWWYSALPLFLPFSFQLIKCICPECDDVEMKCSCIERTSRMSIEATTIECALSLLLFFYLQVWCSTEIKKKRCELSVFLLYLFIHMHYLFSIRMHLFKSIYTHIK